MAKKTAVFGVGIDLTSVARVKQAIERYGGRFLERIFTPGEVEFCSKLSRPYPSYAARFAAKEAFSKALGTGLRGKISWRDIEVCDNEKERPTMNISGRAKEILGGRGVHLSLTHLDDYAAAVVVIEDE
ncbi:MAG: holo-ACP synthase [bacterium]